MDLQNVVHEEQAEMRRNFTEAETEKRKGIVDGLKLRRQEAAAQAASLVVELTALEQLV